MNPSQSVVITFKVYNSREQKKAHAASIFLEQASAKFHWWARGTLPTPSKTLATDQYMYCKERGPGEGSAPSEGTGGQSLRTRELWWGKETAPMMNDGA